MFEMKLSIRMSCYKTLIRFVCTVRLLNFRNYTLEA